MLKYQNKLVSFYMVADVIINVASASGIFQTSRRLEQEKHFSASAVSLANIVTNVGKDSSFCENAWKHLLSSDP